MGAAQSGWDVSRLKAAGAYCDYGTLRFRCPSRPAQLERSSVRCVFLSWTAPPTQPSTPALFSATPCAS